MLRRSKPRSAFQQLTEHGIVVRGQTITISDRAKLQQLANPHPLIDTRDP